MKNSHEGRISIVSVMSGSIWRRFHLASGDQQRLKHVSQMFLWENIYWNCYAIESYSAAVVGMDATWMILNVDDAI